jgi:cytochrome P450
LKTGVSIPQYAAFRSASNFYEPESFIPERWLDDPRFACDRRDVFQPFSCGARSCIGKALGDMEVRLVLANLIYNFDLQLSEETMDDWTDQLVYLTWQKNPLVVKLTPAVHAQPAI